MISKVSYEDQSYKDFHNRFHKAELLPMAAKGLIFVGNTRVGKSTLSCAAAGSQMEICYDVKIKKATIRPVDQKFRDLVNDNLASVTEQPNFFPSKTYAIVDMPGYADSSRFREMINFHYIREMTRKLKEVRFLMVITLQTVQGKFSINKHELKMMQAFMEMFPDCNSYVSLVVNQLETHQKDPQTDLRKFFNDLLLDSPQNNFRKYLKNFGVFKGYYRDSIDANRIFYVKKPIFKNKEANWSEPHKELKDAMDKICNAPNMKFYATDNLNKINVSIFTPGQMEANEKMLGLLLKYFDAIEAKVKEGVAVMQRLFIDVLRKELERDKKICISQSLSQFVRSFEVKHSSCRELAQVDDAKLVLSSYLQLIQRIFNFPDLYKENIQKLKEKHNNVKYVNYDVYLQSVQVKEFNLVSKVTNIFEVLLRLANQIVKKEVTAFAQQEKDLVSLIRETYSILARNLEETFFMWKVASYQINFIKDYAVEKPQDAEYFQGKDKQLGKIANRCKTIIEYITTLISFSGNYVDELNKVKDPFLQFFLKLNLNQYKDIADEPFEKQLLNDYSIIKKCDSFFESPHFNEKQIMEIDGKIEEVRQFFVVAPLPPNAHPDSLPPILKRLLQSYKSGDKNRELQFRIAIKIASILQVQNEYKKAIGLFFHLQLFDKVMVFLEAIASQSKNQEAFEWYLDLGKEFLIKRHAVYFEMCMQKAKSLCYQNVEQLISVQQELVRGKVALKNEQVSAQSFDKSNIGEKVQYWNWFRINDEIEYLRAKVEGQGAVGNIMVRKYREKVKSPNHNHNLLHSQSMNQGGGSDRKIK